MITIGIGGGSCAGKSTLAHALAQHIGRSSVAIIPLDAYYHDRSNHPIEQRETANYDHPDALDLELLGTHLQQIKRGETIEAPVYDFKRHVRTHDCVVINPGSILIIEGILVLALPLLTGLLDMRVYVETSTDIRLIRRLRREIIEWGNSFESAVDLYLGSARPMHDTFVEPSKASATMVVSGEDLAKSTASITFEILTRQNITS